MEHEGAVEHCGAREWLDQSSNSKQQSNNSDLTGGCSLPAVVTPAPAEVLPMSELSFLIHTKGTKRLSLQGPDADEMK